MLNGIVGDMSKVSRKLARKLAPKILKGKGFFDPYEIAELLHQECGYIQFSKFHVVALMSILERKGIKVERGQDNNGHVTYAIE